MAPEILKASIQGAVDHKIAVTQTQVHAQAQTQEQTQVPTQAQAQAPTQAQTQKWQRTTLFVDRLLHAECDMMMCTLAQNDEWYPPWLKTANRTLRASNATARPSLF